MNIDNTSAAGTGGGLSAKRTAAPLAVNTHTCGHGAPSACARYVVHAVHGELTGCSHLLGDVWLAWEHVNHLASLVAGVFSLSSLTLCFGVGLEIESVLCNQLCNCCAMRVAQKVAQCVHFFSCAD